MSTPNFLSIYGLLLLCLLVGLPLVAQEGNVLFLIADDLGVDYTRVYQEGSDFPNTPNIDALARDGVVFRNAWANPVCSPTRATILTGQYGFRTGVGAPVNNRSAGIDVATFTLPKALNEGTDYANACIGKWHLSSSSNGGDDNPNLMGFDYYAGLLEGAPRDYFAWDKVVNGNSQRIERYIATENVDDAIEWLERQDGPWFNWLAFANPHTPFHKPPNELHGFDDLPGTEADIEANPVPYYKAAIEAMDTEIGRLIDYLKATGQYENTTIVYLGDNGTDGEVVQPPFDPEQAKTTLYEGGVNVPFIISGAGVANPGRESEALVSAVDLFATGLELMGVDVASATPSGTTIDSRSLVPLLNGQSTGIREWTFTEVFTTGFGRNLNGKAIREEVYKLIRYDSGTEELYNLVVDPFETNNLLGTTLNGTASERYTYLTEELNRLLGVEAAPPPTRPERPRFPRFNNSTSSVGAEPFSAYPNPSADEVVLSTGDDPEAAFSYTVTDPAGRTVLQGRGAGITLSLNVAQLPSGPYFVNVRRGGEVTVTPIVRK